MNPEEEVTYRAGVEDKLKQILIQTTLTNGRVRWSEKMIYLALGGLGVLSIVVLPLIWTLIGSGKI